MIKKFMSIYLPGETLGLFQIESAGMQDLAKKLKPSQFEDIIAMWLYIDPALWQVWNA